MNSTPSNQNPEPSLATLPQVELEGIYQDIFEQAQRNCGGSPMFQSRKLAEAQDLLALAQISDRLTVHWLDLSVDLRAKVEMRVPVPCLPDPKGPLRVAPAALLGLTYPEQAVLKPQPGYLFTRILAPKPVWLGAVSPDANQVLCLGTLPAGVLLSEVVLMTYGALSMQVTILDEQHEQGMLNAEAVRWWQCRTAQVPLTREAFLDRTTNVEVSHAR